MPDSSLRIVVSGLIAQHPMLGGVAWDYLQYPVGLARLGHDVYYIEDSGQWPYNFDGGPGGNDWVARDCSANVAHLADTLGRFGLGERWAYRFPIEDEWYGLPDVRRKEVIESADLVINVSGSLEYPERYRVAGRLAYIDSDPLFTQVKILAGDGAFRQRVDQHDAYFSFGERFSEAVPETGHRWRPTRQPVFLPEWRPSRSSRNSYTTIMNWTSYQPMVFDGSTFGQKDFEFRRFVDLPARVAPVELEVALSRTEHLDWQTAGANTPDTLARLIEAHPGWRTDELLRHLGWRVVDAIDRCAGLDAYRDYIESSRAEWSVSKHGYAAGRAGWFSCRSACYLATGRPVVVQDTGFGDVLPVGEGLLAFSTLDEAVAAIQTVEADYERHSRAAREIAEAYFDSDRVLDRLVQEALDERAYEGRLAVEGVRPTPTRTERT